jgi:uncharacterized membrane-anchored protein YhcB (DUF1043 family)
MTWVLLIAATVVAFGLGFLAARLSSGAARRSRELDEELQRSRTELTAYRAQVSSHFSRTAELVNELTANYRTVYQHLAEGSSVLCNGDGPRLEALQEPTPVIDERAPVTPGRSPDEIASHSAPLDTLPSEKPLPADEVPERRREGDWYDAPPADKVEDFSREDHVH